MAEEDFSLDELVESHEEQHLHRGRRRSKPRRGGFFRSVLPVLLVMVVVGVVLCTVVDRSVIDECMARWPVSEEEREGREGLELT